MAPSIRDHSTFVRPATRDRPSTRDQADSTLVIPSRTSSLHSRITQPIPSTLTIKPAQRTPKTLTHAYMVCGVGREPSQWVKAPAPSQGKIGHMKGAVGQFWLPEILGSSPRLEQDNEIARALHSAMRVRLLPRSCDASQTWQRGDLSLYRHGRSDADCPRLASRMMSKFVPVEASLIACTTPLCCSKTPHIHCMVLRFGSGRGQTRNGRKRYGTYVKGPRPTSTIQRMKHIGFRTV